MGAGGWTHFVGIGGVGMSGLAQLLLVQGYRVSGSDPKENQFTRQLAAQGAIIYHRHEAGNIAPGVQEVVISSAVPPDNPEVITARHRGLPVIKRGELLARLFNARRGIAVAGAHGKTTTSALVALALKEAGLDPAAVIGGYVREFDSNTLPGRGPYFVAEADESDGSFLWLKPEIALVTNIESDHLDHYGSLERIVAAFAAFLEQLRPGGKAVLCTEDPRVAEIAAGSGRTVITYGFSGEPDYRASEVTLSGLGGRAAIYYRDRYLGELVLKVPGRHNILNALGAIAVAHQLEIPFPVIARALEAFRGVGRRFEVLWDDGATRVVDDYAHHPTEIEATLAAAGQVGAQRVVAVFQPHRYTRTYHLYREFGRAFNRADVVIINDIYAAGEEPLDGVTSRLILDEIKRNGHPQVYYLPTLEETLAFLKKSCTAGDLILTMGAGDIWRVGVELARFLAAKQALSEVGAGRCI
ncbi:UDP-N-acetylmuramate--L-alanine ligase [Moorella mulderi DSM 14980]|uniref:UDP-N-acetylmuramate--L-alanine ligase n=1 Tax=Moorella mulderi DSM 14980 TaxID=1122241 RepID=A0A151AY79_9FIRM|nr:UDP-N-acetylmuramate--L-alanine ligase [Moorella mulderi DSM 14980]